MNERQNYLADGFRNVDRQTDIEKFKICLTAMERLSSFRTYKEETYQLLKPEDGGVFIDVGCGLGFDVERLAKTTSARSLAWIRAMNWSRTAQSARPRHCKC